MELRSFLFGLLTIIPLDLIWVVSQTKYGIYKNYTDKKFRSWSVIFVIWAGIFLSSVTFLSLFIHPSPKRAFLFGFLSGMLAYFIFNGTAVIAFKKYGYTPAIIDTIWGGVLWGTTSLVIHLSRKKKSRHSSITYLDI